MEHGAANTKEHAKWTSLAAMAVLSFLVMYALMYLMVDVFRNVYPNVNQLYMVASMTAAMMLVEVAVMRGMYARNVKLVTTVVGAVVLVISIGFVRKQIAVTDEEFLRSMIPHHGGAILMCKEADIRDPEIERLCETILAGQQSEIDWMRAKLSAMK